MGRKKKYDETDALKKAMFVFWRRGYDAVTTRELADAMGINQFSLYASFESKEALFERALGYYYQSIIRDFLVKPLTATGANKESLRRFLEMFVDPGDGTFPVGCLICNTMILSEAARPEIQVIIDRYQALLATAFANILRRDLPRASAIEIESKASLLLCLTIGIAVRKRIGFEGRPVQIVIDQVINSIYPKMKD